MNKLVDVVALSQASCIRPISCQLKYATKENFLGRVVAGYAENAVDVGLLTQKAARDLCAAQNYFVKNFQLGLFIFDSLRPLRAVKDFGEWMNAAPANDYELQRKQLHYPHLHKNQLGALGYVAPNVSKHCFGNVVDMTLIRMSDNTEINMGTSFDYFDDLSHATATVAQIGQEAADNRKIFFDGMKQFGFQVYEKEFWHFEHAPAEVDQPYDFEISADLKGLNIKEFSA